jgi:hypothetical protein
MRARALVNIASSALVMGSIFLPWIRFNTGETWSAVRAADPSLWVNASLAVSLVVAGGIISLMSRYGGLLTMAGVWLFVASPPGLVFPGAPDNFVITSSFDTGLWLAWAGATASLLGRSWTLPLSLRNESDRRILATGMFPAGVIVLVFGLLFSLILSIFGLILAGTGLTILLSQGESEGFDRIRKVIATIRSVRHRDSKEPAKTG